MNRVAVIISMIDESCQSQIWDGITESARELDIELVTFPAASEENITNENSHYNLISNYISSQIFDGIILFSGAMSEYTDWSIIIDYANSFDIPVVSISGDIGSDGAVIIDNRSGIIELVDHLRRTHEKEHIAFIKGPESNEEATSRFNAYLEALEDARLPYNQNLVFPGNYSEESGAAAVEKLIKDNIIFDAIIGVDDNTALGALKALKKEGIFVPHNVAVVGFDDITDAAIMTPSLTTLKQPFVNMGKSALKLLQQIHNENCSNRLVELNTSTIYRESCGCIPREINLFRETLQSKIPHITTPKSGEEFLSFIEPLIELEIIKNSNPLFDNSDLYRSFLAKSAVELWNRFQDATNDSSKRDEFIEILMGIIAQNEFFSSNMRFWQNLLTRIIPSSPNSGDLNQALKVSYIQQEARIIIDQYEADHDKLLKHALQVQNHEIRKVCQKIITTTGTDNFYRILIKGLIQLGFKEAVLVIFNSYTPITEDMLKKDGESIAKIIIVNKKPLFLPDEGLCFTNSEIIPIKYHDNFKTGNHIFLPLYNNGEYFGYLILNHHKNLPKEVYTELQLHISSALRGGYMLDNLRALSMNDELTGLSNRRGFMLLAKQLYAKAENSLTNLRVFYFDLDGLKKINDSYGHDSGDQAIKSVATLLRRTFRNNDIVGRLGGDEFIAIIEESVTGVEAIVSNRLHELIELFNDNSSYPYKVGVSCGSALISITDNTPLQDKINEADQIMLKNKRLRKMDQRN
jgi:diguanylate cyclase (GGDEF)-like protein